MSWYTLSGEQGNYSSEIRKHENYRHACLPVAQCEYYQELRQSFYQRTEYPANSRVILEERITGETENWTLKNQTLKCS